MTLKRRRLKAIPFIPSLITILNAFFGFLAVISAYDGKFLQASWYIITAVIVDGFDGRIARALKVTSLFGKELDSLCDLVSFGIAPSFMLVSYLRSENYDALSRKIIVIFAFFYFACVAIRLARYNVEAHGGVSSFDGLPSPAGAGFIASMIIAIRSNPDTPVLNLNYLDEYLVIALPYVYLAIGLLMISRIKYPHVMNSLINKKVDFRSFSVMVLIGLLVMFFHESALFIAAVMYTVVVPLVFRRKIGVAVQRQQQITDSL